MPDTDETFTVVDPDALLFDLNAAATAGEVGEFDEAAAELSAWLNMGGDPPAAVVTDSTFLDDVAAVIRAGHWASTTVERIADIVARSGRPVPAPTVECPATGRAHVPVYEDGGGDGPSGWRCDECGASRPAPQRSEP